MTDAVWISDVMLKNEVRVWFTVEGEPYKRQYNMGQHIGGSCLDLDDLPRRAIEEKGHKMKRLPNLFLINGFICLSERAASVLRRFDLGEGGLYPLELLQSDGVTPIPGPFWALNFGARKEALVPEQSVGLRREPGWEPYFRPWEITDDVIAISSAAVSGGPDLWTDPRLRAAFFLSDRLLTALKKEGIAKAFKLSRCKMI